MARIDKIVQENLRRLAPFTSEGDLIENLYYSLFDRPRRRATLAILIKTSHIMRDQIDAYRRGKGRMPLSALRRMGAWCEAAWIRLDQLEEQAILPHQMQIAAGRTAFDRRNILAADRPVSLIGWLDGSQRPIDPMTLDLDLIACLGSRLYAVSPKRTVTRAQEEAILKRAQVLGIGFVDRLDEADLVQRVGAQPASVLATRPARGEIARVAVELNPRNPAAVTLPAGIERVASWPETVARFYAPSFETLMTLKAEAPFQWRSPALPAVIDPFADQSLISALATRSAVFGITGHLPLMATRWIGSSSPGYPIPTRAQWRSAIWAHMLTGQRAGLLWGWTEPEPDHLLPCESLFLFPDLLEAAAHIALDMLDLGDWLAAFPAESDLAVVAGASAYDAERGTWSGPFLDFYRRLLRGQFNPVICPTAALANRFRLSKFRGLIIYNVDGVARKYATRLGSFHREGRHVIAWGKCLTRDDAGRPLPKTRLTASFGLGANPTELMAHLDQLRKEGTILGQSARFSTRADEGQSDFFLYGQSAWLPDGRLAVALVNWSPTAKDVTIHLPKSYMVKTYRDMLTGQTWKEPLPVRMGPWGVSLLTAGQSKSE